MVSVRYRALIAIMLMVAGCGTGKVTTKNSTIKAPANATSEDVLVSAIFQLRPENFALNSAIDKPISLLNSWRFKLAEQDGSVEQPAPADAPADWVSTSSEERLSQAKFDLDDAVHVRDAFFYRILSGYLSDRGRTEAERVGAVVDFVCRNVSLWNNDEVELAMRPFMVTQVGKGSPSDRAFFCAEILRQLRIDSLILRAKSDSKESSDKWLFGAIIEEKILLYDLCLGLPLAGGVDGAAATLAQILANPEILDQMSTKTSYRLTGDDLRDPQVSTITEPTYWCQRMKRLEQALPAEDACVIHESMTDTDGRKGLINRIAQAGNWPAESVKLWRYPITQMAKSQQALTEDAAVQMKRLTLPWMVPVPFKADKDGKLVQGTPERKLQRYRLDHLIGKFVEATQRYLSIRHLELEPHPPELERLNKMAAEDALYWTALCKAEMEDIPGTIDMLKDYLKRYDRHGKWYFPARCLLAQYQAQVGNTADATSLLERSSSEDPYQTTNALRLKRWNAAKGN